MERDGTYRARLVGLGYSQIPGVDYTDNFAPVAHDVSFRIALARRSGEKQIERRYPTTEDLLEMSAYSR